MPVPSSISDLSTTAGSNSPAGTDPIGTDADNYIRAHAAFIAQLRDGSKNLEAGTATAPSLAFTGDSNTGIYSPAADTVGVTTGGAKRVQVDSNGLTVTGNSSASGYFLAGSASQYGVTIYKRQSDGANFWQVGCEATGSAPNFNIYNHSLALNALLINPTNNCVTKPYQASFRASGNAAVQSGSQFLFDTEQHDQGSCFGSSTFTAPVTGVYVLTASVAITNLTGSTQTIFASIRSSVVDYVASATLYIPLTSCYASMSSVVYLTAGATATVSSNTSFSGTLYAASSNYNTFSGYLLG